MNRRQALIACGMMAGGFVGQFAHAKDDIPEILLSDESENVVEGIQMPPQPTRLVFHLGDLTEFVLERDGEQIVIPMDDIWNALALNKGKK